MRSIGLAMLCCLGALLASGCSTPCEELAAEICRCEPTLGRRDACERRAAEQRSRRPPTDADEKRCERLLDTCNCRTIDTPEGKRACGLAE